MWGKYSAACQLKDMGRRSCGEPIRIKLPPPPPYANSYVEMLPPATLKVAAHRIGIFEEVIQLKWGPWIGP